MGSIHTIIVIHMAKSLMNFISDSTFDELKTKLEQGLSETPLMDISSTTIRERLKKRLYCGHLVPGKVLDYIYQNGLYYVS